MEVQAALGSDIALVFDECTPFHVTREYTAARRSARTAGSTAAWLARPRTGPEGRASTASSRVGCTRTCGARRPGGRRARASGSRSAARSGRTRPRCTRSSAGPPRSCPRTGRGTCSESATSTTCCAASSWASTRSTARCRPGSGATGWRSCPTPGRWRVDLAKGRFRAVRRVPILDGCPCPACAAGYSRAYLRHLFRIRETTGARIVTLHNLAYMARLMSGLRDAISTRAARRGDRGAAPWATPAAARRVAFGARRRRGLRLQRRSVP